MDVSDNRMFLEENLWSEIEIDCCKQLTLFYFSQGSKPRPRPVRGAVVVALHPAVEGDRAPQ